MLLLLVTVCPGTVARLAMPVLQTGALIIKVQPASSSPGGASKEPAAGNPTAFRTLASSWA